MCQKGQKSRGKTAFGGKSIFILMGYGNVPKGNIT